MLLIFLVIASTVVIESVSSSSSSSSTSDWSDWILVPSNNSFPEPFVLAISKRINMNSIPVDGKQSIEKEKEKDTTSEITISIKGLAEKFQTAVGFIKDFAASEDDDDDGDGEGTEADGGRVLEESRGSKKKIKKIKKKYKKFLLPLLIAYKLKFFALIPVMIAGLTLLVGTTGLAGFFFALFAAIMALKTDNKTIYKHGD